MCGRGSVAANITAIGPPSDTPMITARSDPAASMTARMSSARSSSDAIDLDPVGEARPTLVEMDDAREGAELLAVPREQRVVPHELDVRHRARRVDEVDRAVAADAVGDRDVAAHARSASPVARA